VSRRRVSACFLALANDFNLYIFYTNQLPSLPYPAKVLEINSGEI
jgi:hypothetical protein